MNLIDRGVVVLKLREFSALSQSSGDSWLLRGIDGIDLHCTAWADGIVFYCALRGLMELSSMRTAWADGIDRLWCLLCGLMELVSGGETCCFAGCKNKSMSWGAAESTCSGSGRAVSIWFLRTKVTETVEHRSLKWWRHGCAGAM
jgi:hypothetical protein